MRLINTPAGVVTIKGPVTAAEIAPLTMNKHLTNFRSPERQKETLQLVANSPPGLVYIAVHEQEIVGYVLFHLPSPFTRWHRHPRILELGAIEVSREWQRKGIARALLEEAFSNDIFEDYVVITIEYFWHWDLKGTRLDVWSYQKMLLKLFGSVGFKRRRTDDPEVLEHPANMLMVRFGSRVNRAYIKAFEDLTYQHSLVE